MAEIAAPTGLDIDYERGYSEAAVMLSIVSVLLNNNADHINPAFLDKARENIEILNARKA